jgi:TPR repeat protein
MKESIRPENSQTNMNSGPRKYMLLPPNIISFINRVESGLADGEEIFNLATWFKCEYQRNNNGAYMLRCAELYRLATEHGSAEAQFYLARCYLEGEGVPKDYEEAMKRIWIGAHEGDSNSQNYLGLLYSKPRDSFFEKSEFALLAPEPDIIEAYAWINLAGATYAGFRQNLESIARQLRPEQTLAAQKRSKELQVEIEARIAEKKKTKKK